MKTAWQKTKQFLLHDMWVSELSSLTGIRALITRLLRIGQLVVKGFRDDNLTVQASALTFTSLISLVPLLAIALALLRGMGAGDEFVERIQTNIKDMPVEFQSFVDQMLDIVNRTNFWALGWVAVIFLFIGVIQLLGSIEASFNNVWGIRDSRAYWRRVINYISIIVIVPFLILFGFAINASMSSESVISRLGEAASIYTTMLKILPYLSTTLALFALFALVPNTVIRMRPALISSAVTAILWLGWQTVYVRLQIGVSSSTAIYGTLFASVPIFLAWLYVSWVIILLGAELCFALQNHATYDLERSAGNANTRSKIMLAFSITLQAGKSFQSGGVLFNASKFAERHRIPVRLINELIHVLVRGGLLIAVSGQEECFVLRRPLDEITLKDIVNLVVGDGIGPERYGFGEDAKAVNAAMLCLDQGIEVALATTSIKQLLDQHPTNAGKT
jgi:membrane protein